ncbi:MAG TPA: VWA domain-containing protein [Candidatus Sulfotelmatobacter sp.]|nr:VWA domain-containing protein [Candidatus Sulfotelmatobacter sp.]
MRRVFALFLACSCAFSQVATPNANPQQDENFVVRINVNLVQIDAVVTDSKGHRVTDLKAEDFEVFQDGALQKITNFSSVAEGIKPVQQTAVAPQPKGAPLTPPPPVRLKPDQVHRVIALVVDDLGISPSGVAQVRAALKKFVDNDLQPGDMVAIIRTGAGIGALQQFTIDRRLLYASIDRVKFNFNGRVSSFSPINPAHVFDANSTLSLPPQGVGNLSQKPDDNPSSVASSNPSLSSVYADVPDACSLGVGSAVGSLAAIRYVVQGLRDLPGRKALVLFSESMQMFEQPGYIPTRGFQKGPRSGGFEPPNSWTCDFSRLQEGLRKLTDAAERAAVVFYTVDPRGADPVMFDVADNPLANVHSMTDNPGKVLADRRSGLRDRHLSSQEGLQYLADETGGTFMTHNDIAGAIHDAVDDSGNYFLIGYRPPASTFDEKDGRSKFHRVEVRVKRPGLKVRSRTGFFGVPGRERDEFVLPRNEQFARTLVSPFAVNDIHLRTTTLFSYLEKPVLNTLIYVDGKDLAFTTEADGMRNAVFDAVAVTFNEDGQAVDDAQKTYTIRADQENYELALKNGLILTLQHPVQKPGPYQMRVAVRDATSQKMGSANQFVEVPDLKRGHLALSGILLKQQEPETAAASASGATESPAADPNGNEAVRIFKTGERVSWAFQIFNAHKGNDQQPEVTVETRLFRDGNEIGRSEPLPVRFPGNVPANRLAANGQLLLSPKFVPGDYALQVVVTDTLAKKKYSMASQWIDFGINAQ